MTVFLTILAISATVILIPLGQPASAKSMYDLGYDHGCTDANAGGHPYLESPGKGPSFHTDAFMQGYNDGYSDCSHRYGGHSTASRHPKYWILFSRTY